MLASNYLGITEHSLFCSIEQLVETMKVTPAEIGEQLLKIEEAETSLRGLIEFLEIKKEESEETKATKTEPARQEMEGKESGDEKTDDGN